ncbi:hypothetical protein ATANTOWER_009712 [Ataeniobius toweri]|uniref:Uncharacterized protein n=1 Tax=Ataeniobius toweri TaxID=208326 RepID=A0ABU7A975_9TELE|nr:hypothetical protein [Ataeniobius toweri]
MTARGHVSDAVDVWDPELNLSKYCPLSLSLCGRAGVCGDESRWAGRNPAAPAVLQCVSCLLWWKDDTPVRAACCPKAQHMIQETSNKHNGHMAKFRKVY